MRPSSARWLALAVGLALMPHSQALASKADDTLRASIERPVDVIDPYYSGITEGLAIIGQLVWDNLIYRDPRSGEYVPMLATSWDWVDDTTLEMELRSDVKWHDGQPFTADDVVYTVNYLTNPDHKIFHPEWFDWMVGAEKLGDHAIRISLKAPFGPAMEYLSGLMPIMPKDFFGPNGEAAANGRLVGTGPYRITNFVPARTVEMERFREYYDGSPKGQPAIGRIEYRSLPDVSTQMAEFLAGGLDWLWKVPPDQAEHLKRMPQFQILEDEVMRINFISYDVEGRSGNNPFQDERVRAAVTMAIDRATMARAVIGERAEVLHTPCYKTQFGCTDASEVRQLSYDLEEAKRLLAEAGYADGFTTTLMVSREPRRLWGEIVQAALAQIGIKVDLMVAPTVKIFYETLEKGEAPMWLASYGSYNMQDVHQILPLFFDGGVRDTIADPELRGWLQEAAGITDTDRREELYDQAVKRIAERAYWTPLFAESMIHAFTSELEMPTWPDENPRFYMARWKD